MLYKKDKTKKPKTVAPLECPTCRTWFIGTKCKYCDK